MTETTTTPDRGSGALKLAAVIVGTLLGMLCIFGGLGLMVFDSHRPSPATTAPAQPPEQLLAAVRDADRAALSGYGWVDKEKGVVRIPIELAKQKLLSEPRLPVTRPATTQAGG